MSFSSRLRGQCCTRRLFHLDFSPRTGLITLDLSARFYWRNTVKPTTFIEASLSPAPLVRCNRFGHGWGCIENQEPQLVPCCCGKLRTNLNQILDARPRPSNRCWHCPDYLGTYLKERRISYRGRSYGDTEGQGQPKLAVAQNGRFGERRILEAHWTRVGSNTV